MKQLTFALCSMALCLAAGCRDSQDSPTSSRQAGHGHDHAPPHGGTPVVIGEDQFHLELVLDPTAAKMRAYVLDGHLEGYVSVAETNFLLLAKARGQEEQLAFRRVPEPASGHVPAKSSLFEAQADWLRAITNFDGRILTITLGGKTFTNISFSFPKGSKHVH